MSTRLTKSIVLIFQPLLTLLTVCGTIKVGMKMSKGTQVRVTENTKEAITKIAAQIQLKSGVRITTDMAIRAAIEGAFPEIAEELGIDTKKEIKEKKS